MTATNMRTKTILLTFDVEDWFQVENFKQYIPYCTWPDRELRVKKNTLALLDILDAFPGRVRATFFVLGWVAKRNPELVKEIQNRGHEVASHGFDHHLCYNQRPEELLEDLIKSKNLLESIIGREVAGYRAPSFSITDETISLVRKAGYLYDSSYNSYEGHGRYGSLTLPETEEQDAPLYTLASSFYEIPVSNLRLGGRVVPWGGGGYFRLLPASVHRYGVQQILNRQGCYTFYMHPWEIDPGQPRVREAKASFRFRHYINLARTGKKLHRLIQSFPGTDFQTCGNYISNQVQ
jgi:polysaccharide deacetylase family protein (PEP-CTERM system associated)